MTRTAAEMRADAEEAASHLPIWPGPTLLKRHTDLARAVADLLPRLAGDVLALLEERERFPAVVTQAMDQLERRTIALIERAIDAALERAARWHEEAAERRKTVSGGFVCNEDEQAHKIHTKSAAAIRAMKAVPDNDRPPAPPGSALPCPRCGSTDGEACDDPRRGNRKKDESA